jgi:hypothetical protein
MQMDGIDGQPESELRIRDVFEGCLERIMPASLVRSTKIPLSFLTLFVACA